MGIIRIRKPLGAFGLECMGMYGRRPTGHLHGTFSAIDGAITGINIMYIYPNMETALLEKFDNRIMRDAQESMVLDLGCDRNGLIYVSQFSRPAHMSPHFYYEAPSNMSFGAGPLKELDPYERKWLELRIAGDEIMGEGIFTRRNLMQYSFVSSYNGFVFDKENGESELYKAMCTMNVTKSDAERRHCKKYSLILPSRNAHIEIPPEFDQPEKFIPSWGPKVNTITF